MHSDSTTPSDLRAAIARANRPLYEVAAQVPCHPSHLSRQLNERSPLNPRIARRVMEICEPAEAKSA